MTDSYERLEMTHRCENVDESSGASDVDRTAGGRTACPSGKNACAGAGWCTLVAERNAPGRQRHARTICVYESRVGRRENHILLRGRGEPTRSGCPCHASVDVAAL